MGYYIVCCSGKYLLAGSSGSNDGPTIVVLDIREEKKCGTNSKMVIVEAISPPITALPKGATCSAPSPSPIAIGNIPANIAAAVINTGRNRDEAASLAALAGLSANCRR